MQARVAKAGDPSSHYSGGHEKPPCSMQSFTQYAHGASLTYIPSKYLISVNSFESDEATAC